MSAEPEWLVLAWRLPNGSSTPRVTIWRSLKRLGAATLTPGAALLPYREELLEQVGWLAQEIDDLGGDAWILPVTELSEAEESRVRAQVNGERDSEYSELERAAAELSARSQRDEPSARELQSLGGRLNRIRARDHFGTSGQRKARRAVERCLAARTEGGAVRR